MSHTPTPWYLHEDIPGIERVMSKNNGDACVVFEVIMKPQDHEYLAGYDKRKSLEHAIEACNAYERLKKEREVLMEALSLAAQYLEAGDADSREHLINELKSVKERIALCKGGAE